MHFHLSMFFILYAIVIYVAVSHHRAATKAPVTTSDRAFFNNAFPDQYSESLSRLMH